MQLTTIEQLKQVKMGDTLFLINPFGNTNQRKINICAFGVKKVGGDKFGGENLNSERVRVIYFADLLRGCKYIYTQIPEANSKLAEVRGGLHSEEVRDYHELCGYSYLSNQH